MLDDVPGRDEQGAEKGEQPEEAAQRHAGGFADLPEHAIERRRAIRSPLYQLIRLRHLLAEQCLILRPEERRGGKECASPCRSRVSPYTKKTKNNNDKMT